LHWRFNPPPAGKVEAFAEGPAGEFGEFTGSDPIIQLLEDGRKARLVRSIGYVGPRPELLQWAVPADIIVDGASIPRAFWSLIGGPFEGRYRNASIVHDHYCVLKSVPWKAVHRMFYTAMRCSGVPAVQAKIMYYAVYRFGPRWPSTEEAVSVGGTGATRLTARTAGEFADDAEAIYLNDLDLSELETLADARDAAFPGIEMELDATEAPASADNVALARKVSVVGGQGTSDDLQIIVAHAALLPRNVLKRFKRKGVRVVACRESVTDFERSLRNVVPRGWERTGKTWDDVPGAYLPERNCVVVATIGQGSVRAIPDKSSGKHGSVDLLVHESLHGYDFVGGHAVLADPGFVAARNADFERLDAYEQQAGDAGLQETFAESGARFFTEAAAMQASWPALHDYWANGPDDLEGVITSEAVIAGAGREETARARGAIGTASIDANGAIILDLRAEGPAGMIGHAQFAYAPGDPRHAELGEHLFGAPADGIEIPAGTVILFRGE